jgi:hypothetical protein
MKASLDLWGCGSDLNTPARGLIFRLALQKHVSLYMQDTLPSPPVKQLQHCALDAYNMPLNGRTQEIYFDP